MKQLSTFNFEDSSIRVIEKEGKPWFVAKDIAMVLDFCNMNDATRCLDDDEKGAHFMRTLGGDQQMSIINESGLYHLI